MSVSVDTKGLFEKAFDNFKKITPALLAIAIASGLVLFLPEAVLAKMSLNELDNAWKRVIGIVFIVSVALIITIVFVELFKKINDRRKMKLIRKRTRENFINLSPEYKRLLIMMLKSDERSLDMDPRSGDTLYLLNGMYIHQAQSYMFVGPGCTSTMKYTPQPWLIDLYNNEPELFQ